MIVILPYKLVKECLYFSGDVITVLGLEGDLEDLSQRLVGDSGSSKTIVFIGYSYGGSCIVGFTVVINVT